MLPATALFKILPEMVVSCQLRFYRAPGCRAVGASALQAKNTVSGASFGSFHTVEMPQALFQPLYRREVDVMV